MMTKSGFAALICGAKLVPQPGEGAVLEPLRVALASPGNRDDLLGSDHDPIVRSVLQLQGGQHACERLAHALDGFGIELRGIFAKIPHRHVNELLSKAKFDSATAGLTDRYP